MHFLGYREGWENEPGLRNDLCGVVLPQIADSIANARKACEDDPTTAQCAVAWDEVEELSAAAKDQQVISKANSDPMEKFCADHPEANECRVYED